MEHRQFGGTGMKVSAIGFGCWEISGTYGPIDAAQFEQAVHRALDAGIDCFDTAEAYGMGISELALAHALGARRRDVCLVTKVGVGYPDAPNRRDSSRARIMSSIAARRPGSTASRISTRAPSARIITRGGCLLAISSASSGGQTIRVG